MPVPLKPPQLVETLDCDAFLALLLQLLPHTRGYHTLKLLPLLQVARILFSKEPKPGCRKITPVNHYGCVVDGQLFRNVPGDAATRPDGGQDLRLTMPWRRRIFLSRSSQAPYGMNQRVFMMFLTNKRAFHSVGGLEITAGELVVASAKRAIYCEVL